MYKVSDVACRRGRCELNYNTIEKWAAFLTATHIRTERVNTAKLGRLTCFESLWDIVNIAKIHRQYSWDVRGWCSSKKKIIIFVSVDPFKERNNATSIPPDPQPAGFMVKPNRICVMIVRSCMNIPK